MTRLTHQPIWPFYPKHFVLCPCNNNNNSKLNSACLERLVGLWCIRPRRLASFIRRSNLPTLSQTCATTPMRKCLQPSPLSLAITSDRNHVLHYLLPPQSTGSQTTTCGNIHITLLSLLELVISLTITLSNAKLTEIYFDVGSNCILIHQLNSLYFLCSRVAFCQPSIKPRLDWIGVITVNLYSAFL